MQQTAKMSHRISIGPEPVLVAHVRSPPAAGSQRPVREHSGTSTRCTLSEGVYPHAQAEDIPTLPGSQSARSKGGDPTLQGRQSTRSEGGHPLDPREVLRHIHSIHALRGSLSSRSGGGHAHAPRQPSQSTLSKGGDPKFQGRQSTRSEGGHPRDPREVPSIRGR